MQEIAMTGAGGFIGSHLLALLSRSDSNLRLVSRRHSGVAERFLQKPLQTVSRLELIELFRGCQTVYHLAGIAHEQTGRAGEAELQQFNVELTKTTFDAAEQAGVETFVWLSSIKVLGDVSNIPFEVDAPYQPQDAYSRSKVAAEQMLLAQAQKKAIQCVIVRPPLVYGPGVGGNFWTMLHWCDSAWPLPFADAAAPRSLVGVANLVEFLCDVQQAKTGIYHVADEQDCSVRQLLEHLRTYLNRSPRLFTLPNGLRSLLPAGIQQRLFAPLQVSTASSYAALDWRPPYSAEQQLKDTVSWFTKQR